MTPYLFDTNVLLWLAQDSRAMPRRAAAVLRAPGNRLLFSPLAIAEVAIKTARGKPDFAVDAAGFRRGLIAAGLIEMALTGIHAVRLADLPLIHKDPFDRLMIAQALAEGVPFVTADAVLAQYPGQVMVV